MPDSTNDCEESKETCSSNISPTQERVLASDPGYGRDDYGLGAFIRKNREI